MKFATHFFLILLCSQAAWAASPPNVGAAAILASESPRIFNGMRADLHMPNVLVAEAVSEFMGPMQHERQLEHHAMVDSCRKHSCLEKIAALVDLDDRKLAAVALLNFRCRLYLLNSDEISRLAASNSSNSPSTCDKTPTLSIYVVRHSLNAEPLKRESEAVNQLRKWGRRVGYSHEEIKIVMPAN